MQAGATPNFYSFLTVQLRNTDASTAAYRTLGAKLTGATFVGCTTTGQFVSCSFIKGTERFAYTYVERGALYARVPAGTKMCSVYANVCAVRSGSVLIGGTPMLTTLPLLPVSAPPRPPSMPKLSVTTAGVAKLSWAPSTSAGTSPLLGYRVELKVKGATVWKAALPRTAATSATVSSLSKTLPYQFRVVAVSAAGDSVPSGETVLMFVLPVK